MSAEARIKMLEQEVQACTRLIPLLFRELTYGQRMSVLRTLALEAWPQDGSTPKGMNGPMGRLVEQVRLAHAAATKQEADDSA